MNESASFGGTGQEALSSVIRSITINVNDYITLEDLQTVSVYIDGSLQGTTDVDGNIAISYVTVGGHTLKLTKTGFIDSDLDNLYNDFIMVI